MKIKTIFWIASLLLFFQVSPLIGTIFSDELKSSLITDALGLDVSNDTIIMFDTFALVVSSTVVGIIFLILGSLRIRNLSALRRLSFLLFVVMGFFALPDLIFWIIGKPTAPLPVILANLLTMGILIYGAKRGKI